VSEQELSRNIEGAGGDRPGVSIVVQAGGESKRMGRDKAHVLFLGRPMIESVVERVAPIADEVLITSNAPEKLEYLGLPVFRDVMPQRGALNGLLTAFSVASHEFVCVLACDMVFASPEMFAAEVALMHELGADVVVPMTGHGYEPFHAVYRRVPCLEAVKAALAAGEQRAYDWYPRVRVAEFDADRIAACDPEGGAFLNVNTPSELAVAEAVVHRRATHAEADARYSAGASSSPSVPGCACGGQV
jgi:molybdopterin-guanine dinucleotide biosynthesis protein